LLFYGFRGTDLSGLKNIAILNILGADFVTNITMLHTLQVLDIVQCPGITSLSGLPKLRELWISEPGRQKISSGMEVFSRGIVALQLVGSNSSLCSQSLSAYDHVQDFAFSGYL
jgi:hypothetical protein